MFKIHIFGYLSFVFVTSAFACELGTFRTCADEIMQSTNDESPILHSLRMNCKPDVLLKQNDVIDVLFKIFNDKVDQLPSLNRDSVISIINCLHAANPKLIKKKISHLQLLELERYRAYLKNNMYGSKSMSFLPDMNYGTIDTLLDNVYGQKHCKMVDDALSNKVIDLKNKRFFKPNSCSYYSLAPCIEMVVNGGDHLMYKILYTEPTGYPTEDVESFVLNAFQLAISSCSRSDYLSQPDLIQDLMLIFRYSKLTRYREYAASIILCFAGFASEDIKARFTSEDIALLAKLAGRAANGSEVKKLYNFVKGDSRGSRAPAKNMNCEHCG